MFPHQTFVLSLKSLALLLPLLTELCSFQHVEAITLRLASNRRNNEVHHVLNHHLKPMTEFEPPPTSTSVGGTTAVSAGGGSGLGGVTSTTTTTTTAKSITTTTTMMDGEDMNPSDFYLLHLREHGLAVAEDAAAADASMAEEKHYDEEEERELWKLLLRRRRRQRRRKLLDKFKTDHDDHQQQERAVQQLPEFDLLAEGDDEEEAIDQADDNDFPSLFHDLSTNEKGMLGPRFSPPSSSAVDDIGDVSIEITEDCNVDDPERLGDGECNYDSYWAGDGYNTLECGWDGGDCCWQTCTDGRRRCGFGYDCHDPRFNNNTYDEENERDPQRRRERQALKALYHATNGHGWKYFQGQSNLLGDQWQWLDDKLDHCYWYGIRCTGGEGYVREIDLRYNDLNGTLPTEIGDLTHLENLNLRWNKLSGTIPASIGNLSKLTLLDVGATSLSGPVPANAMVPNFRTPGDYYSTQKRILDDFRSGYPPYNTDDDYAKLLPDNCADVVGYVDGWGRDCDSYSEDPSTCSTNGIDVGHTADTACCACGVWGPYVRQWKALEELYGAMNGGGWYNSSFWMNSTVAHCDWTGVQCNDDGMVTNITLPANNLRGSLPTSIGEIRWLQILDVSDNTLDDTVPTQLSALTLLRRLDLSRNDLVGSIPADIMDMALIEDLRLSHNWLTGTITPDFRRMSRLKRLDLDHNRLGGTIPEDLGLLGLLRELRISNQRGYQDSNDNWHDLGGPIPVELGDCQYLEVLDLSDNRLTGSLPTELARLTRMKTLLLHDNEFEGYIPSEYGLLSSLENLTLGATWEEEKLKPKPKLKPAPLTLCLDEAFDLHSDPSWCPPERNALKRLYDATGGDGWSNSAGWTDPYGDHCSWYGVGCDVRVQCRDVQNWTDSHRTFRDCDWYGRNPDSCSDDEWINENHTSNTACCVCQLRTLDCFWNGTDCRGPVTSLSLISNGLSGPLPAELFNLSELEDLRLGNNRLVGSLPDVIGTNLKVLQLSGNVLSGQIPPPITSLTNLSVLHLHGNRFSSGIPTDVAVSNMTADCGDPYYYGDRYLSCEDCDICCNSEGRCMQQNQEPIDLPQKTGLFLGCLITFLLVLSAVVSALNDFAGLPLPKHSAVDYCGKGSVYCFFLAKSFGGWILAFATVAAQVGIFTLFLSAANIDNDNSDWEYHMRCPASQLWCESDHTVDYKGWLIFGLIMVAFLGKDMISGIMLVYEAALRTNFFSFVGGFFISIVAGYAVWTSVQYNLAIATSNTALVANAVIILFVNDIDERMYALSGWLFPGWVAEVSQKSNESSADFFSELGTTKHHKGNVSKIIDVCPTDDEQSDREEEKSASSGEDLHTLFKKQNETIEELRAEIKAIKTVFEVQASNGKLKKKFSDNPESNGRMILNCKK